MGDFYNNDPNKKHVVLHKNEEVTTQYFINLDYKKKLVKEVLR